MQLMSLNGRIHKLHSRLCSLDTVNISQTERKRRSNEPKDAIGDVVAKREEFTAAIKALEKERQPLIADVQKALSACCSYNSVKSVDEYWSVKRLIVENRDITDVAILSNKSRKQIRKLASIYLMRMKEQEENGTLKISDFLI